MKPLKNSNKQKILIKQLTTNLFKKISKKKWFSLLMSIITSLKNQRLLEFKDKNRTFQKK